MNTRVIAPTDTTSLPAAPPPNSMTTRRSKPPTRLERTQPLVYLAEDDQDLRRLIADAMRDAGYQVFSAATGLDMLKLLTAASRHEVAAPDIIVMDIRMPRCSGLDVLGALRQANWKQPVIMITGFGDATTHEKAARFGASVVLDKPFDADELVGMIDLLLRLSHAEALRRSGSNAGDGEPETLRSPNATLPT